METDIPLPASQTCPEHINSLRESLLGHEQEISQAHLMGISGEAFRFFYSRFEPLRGHRVFLQNPLRSACSALGYKYTVHYDEHPKDAKRRLKGHLKQKQDVIIEADHDCPLIRYAYHPEKVRTLNGKQEDIPLDLLMRRWNPIDGMFELGPTGYYQFVVEEQDRTPNPRETALGALRRAVKMLKGTRRIQGCAMGLEAFEELRQHLVQLSKSKNLTVTQMERIAAWGEEPLAELTQSRHYAREYLRSIQEHFEGNEQKELESASHAYDQLLQHYDTLAGIFPCMPEKIEYAGDERLPGKVKRSTALAFKTACKRAAKEAVKIISAETKIAEALHQTVRISERTKM